MANTTLYISINKGASGTDDADFTIQSTSNAGADFEMRANATDGNGNTISRIDILLAMEAIERVLESNDIFTTDLEQ